MQLEYRLSQYPASPCWPVSIPARESLAVLDAGRNEFYARRAEREWLASLDEIAAAADAGTPLTVAEERVEARLSAWRPRRLGRSTHVLRHMPRCRRALRRVG